LPLPITRLPAGSSRDDRPAPLADRRGAIALELEHGSHRYRAHVGFYPNGVLGEVFIDAAKQNNSLDALGADAAILLSLLLQHGVAPEAIGHALRRTPSGEPASLIGAVVDELATVHKQTSDTREQLP
jgi:hypothetical protein